MNGQKKIRKRLREAVSKKEDQKRLLDLFEDLYSSSETEKGVKEKLETRLSEIFEELEEKAKIIEGKVME